MHNRNEKYRNYYQMLNIQFIQAQEEAEARDLGIGLLRSPDELSDGEKGNVESPTKFWRLDGFFVSFYGPIVIAIMFIFSPGLDIDYSKMEQVQNVKASVGLIRPSSPSTERPSKRKASSSIRSNSSSRIGASAFTSLHSSQTPGRLFFMYIRLDFFSISWKIRDVYTYVEF